MGPGPGLGQEDEGSLEEEGSSCAEEDGDGDDGSPHQNHDDDN